MQTGFTSVDESCGPDVDSSVASGPPSVGGPVPATEPLALSPADAPELPLLFPAEPASADPVLAPFASVPVSPSTNVRSSNPSTALQPRTPNANSGHCFSRLVDMRSERPPRHSTAEGQAYVQRGPAGSSARSPWCSEPQHDPSSRSKGTDDEYAGGCVSGTNRRVARGETGLACALRARATSRAVVRRP